MHAYPCRASPPVRRCCTCTRIEWKQMQRTNSDVHSECCVSSHAHRHWLLWAIFVTAAFPLSYSEPQIRRSLLCIQFRGQKSKDVDSSLEISSPVLARVVHALHAQVNIAI